MTAPPDRNDNEVAQLNLRLSREQADLLRSYASETYRSINSSLLHLLEQGLRAEGRAWAR